jgi:hypothetical protein
MQYNVLFSITNPNYYLEDHKEFINSFILHTFCVKKSAVACNFLTQLQNFSFIISKLVDFLRSSYVNWDFFGMSGPI